VLARHGQHHDRADYGKDGDEGDSKTFATPARCTPRGTQDADNLNDTEGYVEQDRLEVGVAEVADDEVAKGGNTATCYAMHGTNISNKIEIKRSITHDIAMMAMNQHQVLRSIKVSQT